MIKNIAIAVILIGSLLITGCATLQSSHCKSPHAVIEVRNG